MVIKLCDAGAMERTVTLVPLDEGPWMAMLGAVFMGTIGVEIIGQSCTSAEDPESCNNPSSPFASILHELMLMGGFP
ncbi:hypothetical protein ACHAWF_007186, partial [Thalassiosira exigua]